MSQQALFEAGRARPTQPPAHLTAFMRDRTRQARERDPLSRPPPSRRPRGAPRSAPLSGGARTIEGMPRGAVQQPDPPHGTRARYNSNRPCRCAACKKANAEYMARYRAARVSSQIEVQIRPLARYL